MSGLVHSLWDPPPRDAPELQLQAHRLMMKLLMRIRARVPEALSTPEICDSGRVMDAALAASLNPKIDPGLRSAALMLLQRRMKSVDPLTPNRLFLLKPTNRSVLSPTFGADLADLAQFEQELEAYLLSERPGRPLRNPSPSTSDDAQRSLGLLISLLVTRLGQISPVVLGRVVQSLARPVQVSGRWAWMDIEIPESARGVVQTRRIFMDPTTLSAWLMAADAAGELGQPKAGVKVGQANQFFRRLAERGFAALLQHMKSRGHSVAIQSLRHLCDCQNQRLHVAAMPLVASYARAEISSSSLEASTWLRLIGARSTAHVLTAIDDTGLSQVLSGPEVADRLDVAEQILAGDLDETGLLAEVRALMQSPRVEWARRFDTQLAAMTRSMPRFSTAVLAVSWLRHLAVDRKNKGKRLADGSLHYYRGLLVNRLISTLPPSMESVDADELLDAYEEVIASRRSVQQTSRIRAALADFDRYVRTHHLPDLPQVTLPGFDGGSYAISARIISPAEYQRGLELLDDGSMVFNSTRLAQCVRTFWILAFRFGLRRAEILGLQARDVDRHWVRVRVNSARSLKTSNAYRLIPIHALPESELSAVLMLQTSLTGDDCLFFEVERPTRKDLDTHPVIGRINDLLERVTGDRRLHPHNLRHSASTLLTLGALGPDLGLIGHPYAEPWMSEVVSFAQTVDQAISGQLHRRAGRGAALGMMMGHGDETTTYEHYVHSLDLLLFFSCCSGRFDPVRASPQEHQYPRRNETALLLAMLGYQPTSRVNTGHLSALLKEIAHRRPQRVVTFDSSDGGTPSDADTAPTRAPTLQDLLDIEPARERRGWPDTQAQRDTAIALVTLINKAKLKDAGRLSKALSFWVATQLKNDDWASMAGGDALNFVSACSELLPELSVEGCWVRSQGRKTIKTALGSAEQIAAACRRNEGRIWIRLKDPRPKRRTSRRMVTMTARSRTQSTISWTLQAYLLLVAAE